MHTEDSAPTLNLYHSFGEENVHNSQINEEEACYHLPIEEERMKPSSSDYLTPQPLPQNKKFRIKPPATSGISAKLKNPKNPFYKNYKNYLLSKSSKSTPHKQPQIPKPLTHLQKLNKISNLSKAYSTSLTPEQSHTPSLPTNTNTVPTTHNNNPPHNEDTHNHKHKRNHIPRAHPFNPSLIVARSYSEYPTTSNSSNPQPNSQHVQMNNIQTYSSNPNSAHTYAHSPAHPYPQHLTQYHRRVHSIRHSNHNESCSLTNARIRSSLSNKNSVRSVLSDDEFSLAKNKDSKMSGSHIANLVTQFF